MERINMVDAIWVERDQVKCIFEVENSTNFSMALQRASNMNKEIPKFMIIPDKREMELHSIVDPVFVKLFREYSWKYITYTSILRMASSRKVEFNSLLKIGKDIGAE